MLFSFVYQCLSTENFIQWIFFLNFSYMDKKSKQLGIRLDENLMARLKNFEEKTRIPMSILARNAIEFVLSDFEKTEKITFPIFISPKKSDKVSVKK